MADTSREERPSALADRASEGRVVEQPSEGPPRGPVNREIEPAAFALPVTPSASQFVRSHFATPQPVGTLRLDGAVASPLALSLDALRAMATRTACVTLECAGNGRLGMQPLPPGEPWRRGAVSTAAFTGVPLDALLARAGLRDDVVEILARGADRGRVAGHAAEITYERALPVGEEALVAFEMNGASIPLERGGPLRLVVPGWYGMASVKWLSALEARTEPFVGHFQTESYVYDDGPVTRMRVSSHIVEPADGATLPRGPIAAAGWAWSGEANVARVELSVDAGPWRPATLEREGDGRTRRWAWLRWTATLDGLRPGRHTLRARATDEAGHAQPLEPVRNRLGYGNNVVETVLFLVE